MKRMAVHCQAASMERMTAVQPPEVAAALPQDKTFTKEEFDNFLKGYRSQTTEKDFWITDDMIEGV